MPHAKGWARGLWIAIAVAPAVAILAAILAYDVDVPWWDDWMAIGGMFEKKCLGTLALSDVTSQHNEHRIFFPKLVCLALGSWGGWDVRRETIVTFLLAVLTAWNVWKLLKRTVGGGETRTAMLLFLANTLIFSPAQSANWFKGMQMALLIPPLCLTSSLRLALSQRKPWFRIAGAMILCTIATFSVGNGVLCWIVMLPLLVARSGREPPSRASVLGTWVAGLAANVALYAYGYVQPPDRPSVLFVFEHPLQSIHFFISFLGSPFASTFGRNNDLAAVLLGAVSLALFLGCCLRFARERGERLERSLPWISIGVYSILTALMTTFARVGFGNGQPLASRYVTFSLYLGVALVALIAILLERGRIQAANFACGGAMAIAALGTWPVSLGQVRDARALRLQGKACLQFAGVIEDLPGLRVLHPRFRGLKDRILILDRGGLLSPGLVRSRRAQDIEGDPGVECGELAHLDRRGTVLTADGRALLPGRGEPADAILLAHESAGGESTIFAVFIATQMPEPGSAGEASAWRASFAASKLPADATSVSAWAFDALSGKAFRLRGTPALR